MKYISEVIVIDWRIFFQNIVKDDSNYNLAFFEPITNEQLTELENFLYVRITGDLLDLLMETNGIQNKRFGDYVVFNNEKIKEYHLLHRNFIETAQINSPDDYLFFADNGCGECFGFIIKNGVTSKEVGVYYPIENEFRIVANSFETWANEWYSGRLST